MPRMPRDPSPPPNTRVIHETRTEPIDQRMPLAEEMEPQSADECDEFPWNLYRIGAGGQRSLIRTLPVRPYESDAAIYGAGIYSAIPISPKSRKPLVNLEVMLCVDDVSQTAPLPPAAPSVTAPAQQTDMTALFSLMMQQAAQREQSEAARRDRERAEAQEREEREMRRRELADERRQQSMREMIALAVPIVQSVLQRPETNQTTAILEQLRTENKRLQERMEADAKPSALDKYMEWSVQRRMIREMQADDESHDDDDENGGVMASIAGVAKAALPMLAAQSAPQSGPPLVGAPPALPSLDPAQLAVPLRDPSTLKSVILSDPDGVLSSLTALARDNPELGKSIATELRKAAASAKE